MWVCSFDLETVPCTDTLARLHGLDACDDEQAAELLGGKFAKLPLHRVAVIAALLRGYVEARVGERPHLQHCMPLVSSVVDAA